MHLAIASLGMGMLVAAFTYQDKFFGLFDHFGLPHSLLLSLAEAVSSDALADVLSRFIAELPALRGSIGMALPHVKEASMRNLRGLLPA